MIKSFEISNFRCFDRTELDDCRQVNVIVGENGSGKTTILEALFLASVPSPEIAIRFRQWRGYEASVSGPKRMIDDTFWRTLFFDFDRKRSIAVQLIDNDRSNRSVMVAYGNSSAFFPLASSANDGNIQPADMISFSWHHPNFSYTTSATVAENGLRLTSPPPEPPLESSFFAANHTYSSAEAAFRFSILSRKRSIQPVVQLFRRQFPFIEDLSIEVEAGSSMIFADVTGQREKMPLNLISAGLSKMAAILLAIPVQSAGFVLIDEIENGIHYSKLRTFWESLLFFSKTYNVQIFATTHSAECLSAAAAVAQGNEENFSLIRSRRSKVTCSLAQFSGSQFVAAIEEGIEIR